MSPDVVDTSSRRGAGPFECCGPGLLEFEVGLEAISRTGTESRAVTGHDTRMAGRIAARLAELGVQPAGATSNESARPVQMLELAIDALNMPSIRPFWKAVLAYGEAPGEDGPEAAIVDPAVQLPAIWFQHMDAPRPQRNRIHFDIAVAHDEAEARVQAAVRLIKDSFAPSFWVLVDAEGNEVCVCTWTNRDERGQHARAEVPRGGLLTRD